MPIRKKKLIPIRRNKLRIFGINPKDGSNSGQTDTEKKRNWPFHCHQLGLVQSFIDLRTLRLPLHRLGFWKPSQVAASSIPRTVSGPSQPHSLRFHNNLNKNDVRCDRNDGGGVKHHLVSSDHGGKSNKQLGRQRDEESVWHTSEERNASHCSAE